MLAGVVFIGDEGVGGGGGETEEEEKDKKKEDQTHKSNLP